MRNRLSTFVLIVFAIVFSSVFSCRLSAAQTTATPAAPVHKPAAAASVEPTAIIHTTAGDLHCTLFPKVAPIGVENFIGLSNGSKDWTNPKSHVKKHGVALYDGTIFHRVIPEFMIQGGDPIGNGMGDPGYKFKNESSPTVTFDRPGRLAYANSGPDTNGSQFFITEVPYPSLNGGYTIFGQCDDAAVELVKQIARMATDGEKPLRPVRITHIEIHRGAVAKAATGAKPATAAKKPTQ